MDMISSDQRELMDQALQETCQYSHQLAEACSKISESLREGKEDEGLQTLSQLLEGIGWISQALHMTYPAQLEKKLSIDLAELPGTLDPLVSALGNKDYGLIGDILTFEVQPLLNKWTNELSEKGDQSANEGT